MYKEIKYDDGAIYKGNVENGRRHGFGKYYYPSGNIYEGEWSEGKRDGHGIFKYKGGDVFFYADQHQI